MKLKRFLLMTPNFTAVSCKTEKLDWFYNFFIFCGIQVMTKVQ